MNDFYVVCENLDKRTKVLTRLGMIGFIWSGGESICEFVPPGDRMYIRVYRQQKYIKYATHNICGLPEETGTEFLNKPINNLLRG